MSPALVGLLDQPLLTADALGLSSQSTGLIVLKTSPYLKLHCYHDTSI